MLRNKFAKILKDNHFKVIARLLPGTGSPMCGIAGYVGNRNAVEIVLQCLHRLEYRGYDSFGVGVVGAERVMVRRQVGRIEPCVGRFVTDLAPSNVSIGHTRWATHGRVDERNCHPHVSCDGSIAIVHNGVIENAGTLRDRLRSQGHTFRSDTDSEVVAHLIEQGMKEEESMATAFLNLRDQLIGTYAVLAVHAGASEIYLMRQGSPLVVGVGTAEYFPASDVPSFLPFTNRVSYLPERTGFVLDAGGLELLDTRDGEARRIERAPLPEPVGLGAESISKGSFEHFMIKEILEQAETLDRIIQSSPLQIRRIADRLSKARRVAFIGAGTSYHASLFGKYVMSAVASRHADAFVSSDFEFHASVFEAGDVVIALSQSGETFDTVEALRIARNRDLYTLALTSGELSSVARQADFVLPLLTGPEIAVAATKSYTAQLALIALLAYGVAGGDGTRPLWQARDALFNLTSDAARQHTKQVGEVLMGHHPVFLLGRGVNYVTALEAALKLKEVAGLKAEAFHLGEMKHGPLALIEDGTPVVLFYDAAEKEKAEVAASELASRGARILSVGASPLLVASDHIKVDLSGFATALAQIVPMQILAYELSKLKNLDPDHPRNLAKSVTVP